jgi:vacuolar protein sorting-associated protein 13A/C
VLTLDEEYLDEKQQLGARRQPKDVSEGFSMGAEALGKAVVGGLKGLVSEPARAIENRGIEGLAEGMCVYRVERVGHKENYVGVGRGVVGALMKPVAGIFEMASLTAGGIQEAAGESSGVARGRRLRKRPPRVFYGYDRVIRTYSLVDAKINDILFYAPKIAW